MYDELSRRRFLGTAGTGAAAALLALRAPLQALEEKPVATGDWSDVRRYFSWADDPRNPIPLNAANLCPAFRDVTATVASQLLAMDHDCSLNMRTSDKYVAAMQHTREQVAKSLGATPGEIALVRNASAANNFVVNGLQLEDGDQVLLWDDNHETNDSSWVVRRNRGPVELEIIRLNIPRLDVDDEEIVNAFRDAIKDRPRVRVITFSHVSNHTGMRLPAREICAMAHRMRPDVFVHVDGAQSWGAMSLNLHEMGCDAFSGSGHKWPCGPRESGVLYVSSRWIERMWPSIVAYDINIDAPCRGSEPAQWLPEMESMSDDCRLHSDARRFELLGQRNDASIVALGTAVDLMTKIEKQYGPIERRIQTLANRLMSAVPSRLLITPRRPERHLGVVVFDATGRDLKKIFRELYENFRIAGNATIVKLNGKDQPILRLCPHIYNSEADIDRAITAVHRLLAPGGAA